MAHESLLWHLLLHFKLALKHLQRLSLHPFLGLHEHLKKPCPVTFDVTLAASLSDMQLVQSGAQLKLLFVKIS